MKHRWLKYSNAYINHDPVMTLTKFMARSRWVAYAFEWGKLLKCHLKGIASRKLVNGQNIDYSEKKNGPRASSTLALGLNTCTIIFKNVYWYMQRSQVSVYRIIVPLVSLFIRKIKRMDGIYYCKTFHSDWTSNIF